MDYQHSRTPSRLPLRLAAFIVLTLAALMLLPSVALAQSVSLTATVNGDKSVDLDLSNGPSNWWFRINWWGTCTAVNNSSTVNGISGYQVGTHSVWAYSDSNCASQIATTTFTIQNASLAATVNGDRSVDLTLSNGPNDWYFRISSGSCTAVSGNTVSNIRGYQPGSYGVGAFSGAGCTDFIAAADFTIPDPPPPTATLTTTVNPGPSVDLTLTNGPNNWWFRINWWGSCTAVAGNTVSNIQGYKAGTYSVDAYSDSNCNTKIASASFTIPELALAIAVDSSDRTVDLTLTGGPSDWWFRIGWWGNCTAATGTTVSNIRGYQSGSYIVAVYPASGCAFGSHITAESFTMPTATLTATVITAVGWVDLTLTNGPNNWWFRINSWGTCTAAQGTTVSNIQGYKPGTHYVTAYSDSGCKYHVASSSFTQVTPGARDSGKDITLASGNDNPTGIWSDGTTMWVMQYQGSKVFAYNLSNSSRDSAKDITVSSNITLGNYMTADGTTMWISDNGTLTTTMLYAHSIANRNADSSEDFTLHTDNDNAHSLYTDGTTMWVYDNTDLKIYAYVLSSGARDSGKDITLHTNNGYASGIWTDGATMWVADYGNTKVYAYRMSDGNRDSAKDYNGLVSYLQIARGIWSDGTTMWIADSDTDKLYAHHAIK